MGNIKHLVEYWRRIRALPQNVYTDKAEQTRSCTQKVTRWGIEVNGRKYWTEELIHKYYGAMVNVVVAPDQIRVEDMDKKLIATFDSRDWLMEADRKLAIIPSYEMSREDVGAAMKAVRKIESQSKSAKSPISMPWSSSTS